VSKTSNGEKGTCKGVPKEVRCTGVEDAGCGEEKMKYRKKLKYCM
jgi:hypothetical protein